MWQLLLSDVSVDERRVAEQIIGNLDQNGYLVATLEEIAVQEKVDSPLWKGCSGRSRSSIPPGSPPTISRSAFSFRPGY